MASTTSTVEVRGRVLQLPMRIGAARAAGGIFPADAQAVAARLPAGVAPLRWRPGRGLVLVMAVTYLDNPLGTYDEVVVAPLVGPADDRGALSGAALRRGRGGIFVLHMPVSEEFTCVAGREIWGYPKTLDTLALSLTGRTATATWATADGEVLRLSVGGAGRLRAPGMRGTTYTAPDGALLRTPLHSRASGVAVRPGGARLQLGPGAAALGLDRLGLGHRALAAASAAHVEMTFEAARPVAAQPGSGA